MRAEILHRCIAMCVNLKNIKIKLYYIPNWCIRNLKKTYFKFKMLSIQHLTLLHSTLSFHEADIKLSNKYYDLTN